MRDAINKNIVTLAMIAAFAALYLLTGPHDEPTPGEKAVRGVVAPGAGEQIDNKPATPRVTLAEYYRQQGPPAPVDEQVSPEEREQWELWKLTYVTAARQPLTEFEKGVLLGDMRSFNSGPEPSLVTAPTDRAAAWSPTAVPDRERLLIKANFLHKLALLTQRRQTDPLSFRRPEHK